MQVERDKPKDASGELYATTFYPGTLDLGQAAAVPVEAGADIQGVDIALLHQTRAFRVRGRVSDPDGASSGTLAMVVLSGGEGAGASFNSQVHADGTFEFNQVPPGKYILSAFEMLDQSNHRTTNEPLDVAESDVDGIQLRLSSSQTVSGKVIVSQDRKLPRGLVLMLQPKERPGGSGLMFGQEGGFSQLNKDGSFSIERVMPGDYDVALGNTAKGDDLYVGSIRAGDQDVLSSGLHVGAGMPSPLEIILKPNGAEIECTIVDAEQKPVPEAQVTLLPDGPVNAKVTLRANCQTDASGKCALKGIAPGDYHAFAFAKDDTVDLRDPEVVGLLKDKGTPVAAAESDHKTIQIQVLQSDQ
jgi:hypothetical protein